MAFLWNLFLTHRPGRSVPGIFFEPVPNTFARAPRRTELISELSNEFLIS